MFTADIVLKIQKWPDMPSNMNELLNSDGFTPIEYIASNCYKVKNALKQTGRNNHLN